MKHKKTHRILSMLLAVSLAFSMTGGFAFAADEGAGGGGVAIGTSSVEGEAGKPQAPNTPDKTECICPPVDSGEVVHKEDCPLYEAPPLMLAPKAGDAITILVNYTKTFGGTDLKAAVTAAGGASGITTLKITAGTVTENDWKALKTTLPALETFEIADGVTVANIPDVPIWDVVLFPTTITSVTIPQAITVGKKAFYDCTVLTTVSLPAVTSIGADTFSGCKLLASVSLPAATTIGDNAFYECTKLASVSLPAATTIGKSAFFSCKVLATLKLGATVPDVTSSTAFSNCAKTRNLVIVSADGNALSELTDPKLSVVAAIYDAVTDGIRGSTAFDGLWYDWRVREPVAPPKITIQANGGAAVGGDSLSDAVGKALNGASTTSIITLKITAGTVTADDWKYFAGGKPGTTKSPFTALTTFEVADNAAVTGVANIPDGIAEEMSIFPKSIVSVTIPQVTTVGTYAFATCFNLTTVSLPKVTTVGKHAFYECNLLSEVDSLSNAITIGKNAFYNCKALTSVSFPVATSIGQTAFLGCVALTNVNLPAATSIGDDTFSGCTLLASVSLPAATSIGINAFQGCTALATVTLPAATSIGENAFYDCAALATLKLPAAPPPVTSRLIFNDCPKTTPLVIVDENGKELTDPTALATAIAAYKAVLDGDTTDNLWYGWTLPAAPVLPNITITVNDNATPYGGDSLSDAVSKSGVAATSITALQITAGTVIDADWKALKTLTALTDFEIANDDAVISVAAIPSGTNGNAVFPKSITTVSIPQAITVGEYAFQNCTKLTTVTLPKTTSVGERAFSGCEVLTTVTLSAAKTISTSAFSGCAALATITLPAAETIGENAFFKCTALTSVILPAATNIGAFAFNGCAALTTADLPKTTYIGESAFVECTKLATLKLGADVPTVPNRSAFDGCPATRNLTLVGADGITPLKGDALTAAQAAYDKATDYMTGSTATDGLWFGWKVREPVADPVASWAVTGGGTGKGTLTEALAAVKASGGTVTLLTDVEVRDENTGYISTLMIDHTFEKAVTLVLDGHTLTGNVGLDGSNTGLFTIDGSKDGSTVKSPYLYAITSLSGAQLKLKGGTYTCSKIESMEPYAIMLIGATSVDALDDLLADGYMFESEEGFGVLAEDGDSMAFTGPTVKVIKAPTVAVTGVTLNKTALSLEVDKDETLTAHIAPANATSKTVTWESSAADVATVDANGKVTAVAVGSATITVTTTDGNKTATCAVIVTAAVTKPAPGGKLDELTPIKVDEVFGPGNATLDDTASPPKITIKNDITTEKPIELVKSPLEIDLGGNTVTGKPGQPGLVVGGGDKVDITGGGTVSGGDNPGGTGGNGITGGTGSDITIGGGTTVEGGDGGTGGNGITGGGNVTVDGSVSGGNGSSGNGGNGVDTSGGSGNITVKPDGSATGGNSSGGNGNGGNGTSSGGNTVIGGDATGGNGSGSGSGGNGATDTAGGSGSITVQPGGSSTGGNGGTSGGAGGDGVENNGGGNTVIGGDATGGNGSGSGSGGNGTTTGSGDTTISGGGSATGGAGGSSSSGTGGAGGNGSASTGGGSIEVGGSSTGGAGGGGTTGGTGGTGTATGGDTTISGGGSATGGTGGTGTTGGNGGDGADSGSVTVENGGTANGGTGGTGTATGGNGGNGTDSSSGATVNGGATGGSGGSGATGSNGNGGNGGNGANQGSGTVVGGSGTATGGDGGSGAGTGNGGAGGAGVGGGASPGGGLIVKNGISTKIEVVGDTKTEVKLPDSATTVNAVMTDVEKADKDITDVKVTLKVDDKTADKPADAGKAEAVKPANSVIGAFFDITLQKTITKNNVVGSPETVTNVPNGVVTITIEIPTDMRDGSNYAVIRVHNETGEKLITTQSGNELTFETDKFSTYAIAYTKNVTPPTPPSDNTSGGGGSSSDDGYDFWMSVKEKIQNADSGDVVKVNAKGYDKMPWSVMDALRKNSGVSLVITWNGKTITIPAGKAQKNESGRIYWPLSKLAVLYADIAEDTVLKPVAGTNPETGGPGKYIPVTGGGELITLEAPSPTIENTLPNGTENTLPNSMENTQTIAPTQPNAITPPDAGFEQDAFAGTEDAKQANSGNTFAVIALMLAAVAVGSGVWFWKKRWEVQ